jgi:hypothetical protein
MYEYTYFNIHSLFARVAFESIGFTAVTSYIWPTFELDFVVVRVSIGEPGNFKFYIFN